MDAAVFLIGAGPGDPGLITERARSLLRAADVIVYDRLAAPELLALARDDAELINAGKRRGDHTLTQDETNDIIVDRARQGRMVVRLKGGDPLLFGRGGEEAAACRAAGVAFEFVPGITSALSVPMYAGIPVTHRGVSDLVTVITGHRREPEDRDERRQLEREVDDTFRWLAKSPGTVVILMGLARLRDITRDLIRHGMRSSTPAAVISHGTRPDQRTVVGTVGTLPSLVADAGLTSPAIIVVGEVVRLRDELEWFERRPLFGRTIVVTRARAQASDLAVLLRQLGAEVVEAPTIGIERLDTGPLDAAIDHLRTTDLLCLTSANGADAFFERLHARGLDARALHGTRVCVVGTPTARVVQRYGVIADLMPPEGARTSEGMLALLGAEPTFGTSVLIVTAEQDTGVLAAGLSELGATTTVVRAYRTVVQELDDATRAQVVAADLVTFTAASTARNLAATFTDTSALPPAISIGPRTTVAARDLGLDVVAEATDPSIEGMVVALLRHVESAASRPVAG